MSRYKLTKVAEEDIYDIVRYTAKKWGVKQAEKYKAQLKKCFSNIARDKVFSRQILATPPVYMHQCEHHYIFYLKQTPTVIIAILHSKMDLMKRLEERF